MQLIARNAFAKTKDGPGDVLADADEGIICGRYRDWRPVPACARLTVSGLKGQSSSNNSYAVGRAKLAA